VRFNSKAFLCGVVVGLVSPLCAQSLAPRAYVITPEHWNAVIVTWSFYDGGFNVNGALPITGATGTYNVPIFSVYHSFSFSKRSASITAVLPYGVGNFLGKELGAEHSVYRSGLLDFTARFSLNLKGGPAMKPQQYAKWKQKMLLGASLTVVAPTGQYDPTKFVNWSINRWAFKPEFGYSQRWGTGSSMDTQGRGSTAQIPLTSMFRFPNRKPKRPSGASKAT
jgi:hypothetical protein